MPCTRPQGCALYRGVHSCSFWHYGSSPVHRDLVLRHQQSKQQSFQCNVLPLQIEGRGNGIKTNVVNNVEIAKALERPPDCECHRAALACCCWAAVASAPGAWRPGAVQYPQSGHACSALSAMLPEP